MSLQTCEAGLDPAELLAVNKSRRLRTGATAEPAETEAKTPKPAAKALRSRQIIEFFEDEDEDEDDIF